MDQGTWRPSLDQEGSQADDDLIVLLPRGDVSLGGEGIEAYQKPRTICAILLPTLKFSATPSGNAHSVV
jgi:hypothetical protein